MESFGLMDASGVGFYLLLPLYLCLHPLAVEMSVCTFSIACEHGDWGYDQCKCTIWHSELEVRGARGNRGEERNHLPYVVSCSISTVRAEMPGKNASCAVNKYIYVWLLRVFCPGRTAAGVVTFKIHPSAFTVTWLPLPLWAWSHIWDTTTCMQCVLCVLEEVCLCVRRGAEVWGGDPGHCLIAVKGSLQFFCCGVTFRSMNTSTTL